MICSSLLISQFIYLPFICLLFAFPLFLFAYYIFCSCFYWVVFSHWFVVLYFLDINYLSFIYVTNTSPIYRSFVFIFYLFRIETLNFDVVKYIILFCYGFLFFVCLGRLSLLKGFKYTHLYFLLISFFKIYLFGCSEA